jgi:hypothetical protein
VAEPRTGAQAPGIPRAAVLGTQSLITLITPSRPDAARLAFQAAPECSRVLWRCRMCRTPSFFWSPFSSRLPKPWPRPYPLKPAPEFE